MNWNLFFGAVIAVSILGGLLWADRRGNAAAKSKHRAKDLKVEAKAEKVKSDALQKAAGTPVGVLRDRLRRHARKKRDLSD